MSHLNLGRIGASLDVADPDTVAADAAELERLGYDAIWLPGGQLRTLDVIGQVVRATEKVPVISSIIPVEVYDADTVLSAYTELEKTHPGRFIAGIGGAHGPNQLARLGAYFDRLDAADPPLPAAARMLSAIGPRKLELARDRTAGTLPLLVTPAYTQGAREILGPDANLSIHQFVILDTDGARARELARESIGFLVGVGGYATAMRRMGFTEAEISGLADRLVDELVAWGDRAAIADRVTAHLDAGADHVAISVLHTGDGNPHEAWRQLAETLLH